LYFAGDEIRGSNPGDKAVEVMKAAIEEKSLALQFASGELRGDREVVCKAITQNWKSWQHALEEGKKQAAIVACQAFAKSGDNLDEVNANLLQEIIEHINFDQEGAQKFMTPFLIHVIQQYNQSPKASSKLIQKCVRQIWIQEQQVLLENQV
jgi:hypothetical protein